MSERTIVLLMGLIAGILLCCLVSLLTLALEPPPAGPGEAAAPPASLAVEVVLSEGFLNRAAQQALEEADLPWEVGDLALDVRPGGRIDFAARVEPPLGPVAVRGTTRLVTQGGRLAVEFAALRAGDLPLMLLARPFLSEIEAQINQEANAQLAERAGRAKLRLAGIGGDERQLILYFSAVP